jgi:hypothetical protein
MRSLFARRVGRSGQPAKRNLKRRLRFEALEPRTLLSAGATALDLDIFDFDGDTSQYVRLDDAEPLGESYMLFEEWGGNWSDAEKSPSNTEDDNMCWAAAASNMLEWTGWGLVARLSDADAMFWLFPRSLDRRRITDDVCMGLVVRRDQPVAGC